MEIIDTSQQFFHPFCFFQYIALFLDIPLGDFHQVGAIFTPVVKFTLTRVKQ